MAVGCARQCLCRLAPLANDVLDASDGVGVDALLSEHPLSRFGMVSLQCSAPLQIPLPACGIFGPRNRPAFDMMRPCCKAQRVAGVRSQALDQYIALGLPQRAREIVADIPRDLLARTAAFLLLKDSKSSYAIEGERPPQDRIQRWGRAIAEAGRQALDLEELLRLQTIVIGDARFVKLGLRQEGGFVGEHGKRRFQGVG